MSKKLQQLLRATAKACHEQEVTEAEVEKIFQERGFFLELGYEGFGKDILAQRGKQRKRFDVALTGFGGRVHAVIEFKKPTEKDLDSFREELLEKYVKPHLAIYGVLTNGEEMLIYARTNGHFPEQRRFKLSETTEGQARDVYDWLRKQSVHMEILDSVLERLRYHRQNVLLIGDPDSEAARIFFQVFQLRPESAFGRLVISLKRLLPKTAEVSRFARGCYDFWLRTYARELTYKNIPATWREFLTGKSKSEIAQFSFALETAYSIISRLILAKAANDKGFPFVRFIPRIQESLNELAVRGRLSPDKHREIVERCFRRASEVLFATIFLQDIFDWWLECPVEEGRSVFLALGESILTVTQFDFLELSGDLLGALYQRYFDRDTRKALGEFYTPPEVIEFILDECGYNGQRGERLLDPSCGSGSFLASALRRYLKNAGKDAKRALQDLTDGLRIVGFDINPFAVLMAQVNYAALILGPYSEAIKHDPDFRILRLPVFRTDSLRMEEREEEGGGAGSKTPRFRFEEKTVEIKIYLPIKGQKKPFHQVSVSVPRYQYARSQALVTNLEEYVAALACVFQAVRDRRHKLDSLLRSRFGDRVEKLQDYLQPTVERLEATVEELRGKFEDGRFLKTIEDLVLAVSLKHDLQYDFVVGNPPYVRIQKIPEHVKEYWQDKYQWTERNYDLYVPFLERAVRSGDGEGWLGKNGKLGFILSDRFLNVDYGRKIREELPKSLRVDLLFDLRDTRVFEAALNYPAILIAERDGKPQQGQLVAARVFTSEADFHDLVEEFQRLRKEIKNSPVARSASLETFPFPRTELRGDGGWWLMPADERSIFRKLSAASATRLFNVSVTNSAAFQGWSTSADSILVSDEVEDLGKNLRVSVRHEGDGCESKPVEIEKGALRPFLFGKDVHRWTVDWQHTWVMFPYDRYLRKQMLNGDMVEDWNLIPCKANLKRFEFVDPDSIELFEDRFPNAWKYLRKHENDLRKREDGRYESNKPEGHLWYGATYPRGLDYYFRPKLVLQLLSRRNSFAFDAEGKFVFQAGGKGGGVYGFAPGQQVADLGALLAFLNSKTTDFLIKETSSVYGGRFYSYADQFLRDLPIATELLEKNNKVTKRLSRLTVSITNLAAKQVELKDKIDSFPTNFERELSEYELDTIGNVAREKPASAQLSVELDSISVEKALYNYEVRYGAQRPFAFEHREQAECLAEALRNRGRKSLALRDVLSWRLPSKREGCQKLLELLGSTRRELSRTQSEAVSQEGELNDLVYSLYGVTAEERKVIESFLERYSSHSAAEAAEREVPSED
ncbi:MAG: Eco57I restriction-modification methylase domain-containing protein [Candidatus Acidiferrales bacterium]